MTDVKNFSNAELYTESGFTILDTNPVEKDMKTILEPNAPGTMIF